MSSNYRGPLEATRVVVMGVAGSGKSTVACVLAERLGATFVEADGFHLPASVEKMSNGQPLDDDDRWPWLLTLRNALRDETRVVLACSALARRYRDVLRSAGDVRFIFLDVAQESIEARIASRTGHFMPASMIESQFSALERPADDETDVATIHIPGGDPEDVMARVEAAVASLRAQVRAEPLRRDGNVDREITIDELRAHIDAVSTEHILASGATRVLLVPPDHTRLHSRAGEITAMLHDTLTQAGCTVKVLPALGTHAAMTRADAMLMFGETVPYDALITHRWRDHLVRLGEIGAAEVGVVSDGRFFEAIPIETDETLLDGWDLVVSIGQVVPHEVIGMANFTKNLVIGLGGAPTIHRSHFLGAVSDMETLMGRTESPVRHVVDAAFDRFVASRVKVLWILTVMEDSPGGVVQRGLFVGAGRSTESGGGAYRAAAELSARCNIEVLEVAFARIACWLDPNEFRSTWLGNKAIYRARMALADGGELVVLAPGVCRFGEDPAIDALIRRHGYRGTSATMAALREHRELSDSLGAAAHLIHGSSEGRFSVTYCTDPDAGGLSEDEVRSVGYNWRPLPEELVRLSVSATTPAGPRSDSEGVPFDFIANPALGLWTTRERFGSAH